jgi:tetratricopeptide (TPR) repeat protein
MWYLTGDFSEATDAHTRALEIFRQLGNHLGEATALTNLGRMRYFTGDFPGAEDAHTRALEIFRRIGNRLGEATALNDLGRVRYLAGIFPGLQTLTRAHWKFPARSATAWARPPP